MCCDAPAGYASAGAWYRSEMDVLAKAWIRIVLCAWQWQGIVLYGTDGSVDKQCFCGAWRCDGMGQPGDERKGKH